MKGKMGVMGALVIFGVLFAGFCALQQSASSTEYATGSTTMNVTVRGYVSISASSCLTNGITFTTQDPGDYGTNATCNNNTGSGNYNLTTGSETTVNVNFTHASNRTELTTGTYNLNIGNLTTNSATSNVSAGLLSNATATALSSSWLEMENCGTLAKNSNCYATYFLDVPLSTQPGLYIAGYCWCGRQTATAEGNCGACT
jgi:hypothetical protein